MTISFNQKHIETAILNRISVNAQWSLDIANVDSSKLIDLQPAIERILLTHDFVKIPLALDLYFVLNLFKVRLQLESKFREISLLAFASRFLDRS